MMGMLTRPHAKPEGMAVKDCTHILSEMRMVKEPGEIDRLRATAKVAEESADYMLQSGYESSGCHQTYRRRWLVSGHYQRQPSAV